MFKQPQEMTRSWELSVVRLTHYGERNEEVYVQLIPHGAEWLGIPGFHAEESGKAARAREGPSAVA